MIIGVVSDTHGVLNSNVEDALVGVDHIIHAGDIDRPGILHALKRIAPVSAVRGNMDQGHWAHDLPICELVEFRGVHFYLLHNLDTLDIDPVAAGIKVVISGHTHQSSVKTLQNVLYFNPGSASYGRHGSPLSVGRIQITEGLVTPQVIELES